MAEISDVEMESPPKKLVPKKPKTQKDPSNENEDKKKLTTKMMILDALLELKTRKGVSLQAIKKYLHEKYSVDTEKNNYLIKKSIKNSVESGSIVQTKGIGASGSFKLAVAKTEKPKLKKPKETKEVKEKKVKEKKLEKPTKAKKTETKEKTKKTENEKKTKKKSDAAKEGKTAKKEVKSKKMSEDKDPVKKTKAVKMAKGMQTPSKKKTSILKRKSLGSIIKAPKMKPNSKTKP